MAKYKIIPSSRTIVQSPISIGHKAEKGVEAIEFDLTAWVETYGSGTLTVIMRRWGDAIPYPIALEIDENNKATWTLSDIDTAKAGMAYAQLNYIVGDDVVKKSDIYTFRVMDSLTGEGDPPEAYESWLEHLTHLAAEAMAEVLDIEGIVTDKTLSVDGGIADAKKTGDELSALKADLKNTFITSYYTVPLTWEMGSISSTGEDTESTKTRSAEYVPTTYGDLLIKASTTGMNIIYYDYDESQNTYIFKANAWASSNTVHEIRKQYSHFRITTNVNFSNRPYDTIYCYKYIGAYSELKEFEMQTEAEMSGIYMANVYTGDGKKVTWIQASSGTTLDFTTVEGIGFEAFGAQDVISVSSILSVATASSYTTVSGTTISGNNFAIVYNVETKTVSIEKASLVKKQPNTRILFSVYYGSFVSGELVDYVIRRQWENTISRIDNLENVINVGSNLPSYWLTYMQTKIRDVQAKDTLIGANGDSFIFCTDQHYPTNTGNAPEIIKYVLEHSSVRDVVMGGDLIQGNNSGKQQAINDLVDSRNKYTAFRPKYLRGNHDNNTEISGATSELAISDNELYGILLKPIENDIVADKKLYYYFDNPAQKIRYICLDTGHPDTNVLSDAQITWMQSKITELSAGWTVVVFTHQFFASGAQSRDGNGDKILAGLDAIYDTADAVIACVICGHNHLDASTVSTKGYPIIVTTCEFRQGEASGSTRTAGTYTEDAFDVFHIDTVNRHIYATRIGFNVDRDWTY